MTATLPGFDDRGGCVEDSSYDLARPGQQSSGGDGCGTANPNRRTDETSHDAAGIPTLRRPFTGCHVWTQNENAARTNGSGHHKTQSRPDPFQHMPRTVPIQDNVNVFKSLALLIHLLLRGLVHEGGATPCVWERRSCRSTGAAGQEGFFRRHSEVMKGGVMMDDGFTASPLHPGDMYYVQSIVNKSLGGSPARHRTSSMLRCNVLNEGGSPPRLSCSCFVRWHSWSMRSVWGPELYQGSRLLIVAGFSSSEYAITVFPSFFFVLRGISMYDVRLNTDRRVFESMGFRVEGNTVPDAHKQPE